MKLGAKNLEWFLILGLIVSVLVEFLVLATGLTISIQQAITNSFLLLIFAGQLLTSILLLRIYDKMR